MSIISTVDYNTATQYKNCVLSTKHNGKKHKVYLRMICDEFTLASGLELVRVCPSIVAIEYVGQNECDVYKNLGVANKFFVYRVFDYGENITFEDVDVVLDSVPSGVVPVIHLPETFTNIELLHRICQVKPKVRFYGGNLFCIDGVRVGCIGMDFIQKHGIKYNPEDYYIGNEKDALECLDINSIKLEINVKSVKEQKKTTKSTSNSGGSSQPKKKKQPAMSFTDMLLQYKS